MPRPLQIGSVAYLNARPLVEGLQTALPDAEIRYEVPSQLADLLAQGELDVALAPCIELARHPEWAVLSDACIGCRGPVLSVKLLFRKPPEQVQTLAVDEGSRTSVVLSQVLLNDIAGVRPRLVNLPLNVDPSRMDADAVLVIGDRAMHGPTLSGPDVGASATEWLEAWDLGDRWCRSTETPLAFAAWIVRDPDSFSNSRFHQKGRLSAETLSSLDQALRASRDRGVASLEAIAAREAVATRLSYKLVLDYFRDNLNYYFDVGERRGLELYFQRAVHLGLIPASPRLKFYASPVRH